MKYIGRIFLSKWMLIGYPLCAVSLVLYHLYQHEIAYFYGFMWGAASCVAVLNLLLGVTAKDLE